MVTPDTAHYASRRRSTRVSEAVFLKVTGSDGDGQSFLEQTGTIELSFQGCRYFSRHAVPKDSWLMLEIHEERGSFISW